METYPWQPSLNVMKLRTLNPEDVGWNHGTEEWEWDCMIDMYFQFLKKLGLYNVVQEIMEVVPLSEVANVHNGTK